MSTWKPKLRTPGTFVSLLLAAGCGTNSGGTLEGNGGSTAGSGGVAQGGNLATSGGAAQGGTTTAAGAPAAGGMASAGAAPFGGASAGGASNAGGAGQGGNSAGASNAGASTGGAGGKAAGGASNGGAKASGGTSSAGGATAGGGSTTGGASAAGAGGAAGGSGGAPYRGVANSPCAARTALKVSWYYNWEQAAKEPCSSASIGGEYVPMIWGHTGAEQTGSSITSAISTFVSRGNKYVLGFNEPDNTGQANLSVATAIMLWPSFDNAAIALGSPASQANTTGTAWFSSFMSQVNANSSLRVDFIAMHWYGWNAGSCEATASTLENYLKQIEAIPGNRPIWLTEWGCLHDSAPDNATTQAHVSGAIKMFAKHPRLVRYAWYPWAGATHSLNNSDGSLTPLGEIYAAAPAYK